MEQSKTLGIVLSCDRHSGAWNIEPARIEGIPSEDGAYWYYKLGEKMPSMVLIGEYMGERAIKEGAAIQRYWLPGEFFVGPIQPPFATPDDLASPSEEVRRTAYENPCTPEEVRGKALKEA